MKNQTTSLLRQAQRATSRRQLRLIRGKFEKQFLTMSEELHASAMREFRRIAPNPSTLKP
jgi:hypothetical protein